MRVPPLRTPRLELIAATAELISLEIHDLGRLATALDTTVPDIWPPPLNDEGSERWALPAFQACGYATEASRRLIAWAFSHAEVDGVIAETMPDLRPSIRVMEKCGMQPAFFNVAPKTHS